MPLSRAEFLVGSFRSTLPASKTLSLSGESLSDSDLQSLLPSLTSLASAGHLTHLDLSFNKLTTELPLALPVAHLSLRGNPTATVTQHTLQGLADTECAIRSLDLSLCELGRGAGAVVLARGRLARLARLDMARCGLGLDDALAVAAAVANPFFSLEVLGLAGNGAVGDEGAAAILAALPESRVESLNLSGCSVTALSAEAIHRAVCHAPLLAVLAIEDNPGLTGRAIELLAEALTVRRGSLRVLRVAGHGAGEEGCRALSEACRLHYGLEVLETGTKRPLTAQAVARLMERNRGRKRLVRRLCAWVVEEASRSEAVSASPFFTGGVTVTDGAAGLGPFLVHSIASLPEETLRSAAVLSSSTPTSTPSATPTSLSSRPAPLGDWMKTRMEVSLQKKERALSAALSPKQAGSLSSPPVSPSAATAASPGASLMAAVERLNHTRDAVTAGMVMELSNKGLGDADAIALLPFLRIVPLLDLTGNQIGPAGCHGLSSALSRPGVTLVRLILSGNPIEEAGVVSLAEALAAGTPLLELGLRATGCTAKACSALARSLLQAPPLDSLDLSENPLVGAQGVVEISRCLHTVRAVNLSRVGVTSRFDEAIAAVVGAMSWPGSSMASLRYDDNMVTDDSAAVIARALWSSSLTSLSLRENFLTQQGVAEIARALRSALTLKSLDLRGNAGTSNDPFIPRSKICPSLKNLWTDDDENSSDSDG
jgi:hypothetical protein